MNTKPKENLESTHIGPMDIYVLASVIPGNETSFDECFIVFEIQEYVYRRTEKV